MIKFNNYRTFKLDIVKLEDLYPLTNSLGRIPLFGGFSIYKRKGGGYGALKNSTISRTSMHIESCRKFLNDVNKNSYKTPGGWFLSRNSAEKFIEKYSYSIEELEFKPWFESPRILILK